MADGKPAVTVQAFTDQPSSILAVRSKRSDAFFSSQAPLTYFVNQAKGQLELAGKGQKNGFGDIFQGTVVPEGLAAGSGGAGCLQRAVSERDVCGHHEKWQLEGNMTTAPGLNLAKEASK